MKKMRLLITGSFRASLWPIIARIFPLEAFLLALFAAFAASRLRFQLFLPEVWFVASFRLFCRCFLWLPIVIYLITCEIIKWITTKHTQSQINSIMGCIRPLSACFKVGYLLKDPNGINCMSYYQYSIAFFLSFSEKNTYFSLKIIVRL